MNKKNKNKKKMRKKFKLLRNFSTKFSEGLLCLDSPHKSTFAKKILNEIIPQKLSNQYRNNISKIRKTTFDSECSFLILNTPKANHSFLSNSFFLNEKKANIHEYIKKRKSQNVKQDFMKFFHKRTMSFNNITYNTYDKKNYIQDIIEEDNKDNNNNTDENFFIIEDKNKIPSIKLNLQKAVIQPEKILINNNKNILLKKKGIKSKSNNKYNIKNISKPFNPQKLYLKKCDLKKHFYHEKFISNFLTPINQFMKKDFHITNNEYENINKKIHNYNYMINNNDFSLYKNKRKKETYKKFCPPKIPNINKIIESKYFTIINELKNYKFKI
jgi:hypothetical protein